MQRNFIYFILVSALILSGWFYVITFMSPAKKSESPDNLVKVKSLDKNKTSETNKMEKKQEDKKTEPKIELKKKDVKGEKQEAKKRPLIHEEALVTETLGGEGFHLTVDTTSRGAGLRKVTLNRFKAANWLGEPTERDLELIQDDEFEPSFRMYHYAQPEDEFPQLGLGENTWKLETRGHKTEGNTVVYHEVQYSTTVPGMDHIKVIKTYRLMPRSYHITLLLELLNTMDPGNAKNKQTSFRYQLTGGQGLPIEGEWYTSTFRNAMIGLVDTRGALWRKLEDSTRISLHRGGDSFPEDKKARGNNRLQYAGVANQYFASMLVVDDQQPDRNNGGDDPAKILAWARPTHESMEKRGLIKDFRGDFLDVREDKGGIITYRLLPRTKQHIQDLDLQIHQKVILSYYELPDGQKVASWIRPGETYRPQFDEITMRVNSEAFNLVPGDRVAHQYMLYHGPVKVALLSQFSGEKEVPDELVETYTHKLHLRTMTDYHSDNWIGAISSKIMLTDVIILFTRLMHWLLNKLQYVFGYGLSIVVLTIMVRAIMFPISRRQAMFSIKMQELAPELKKIQEKYPDDPAAKMQATQEFYRKHGINPLGSCWPLFLQMPIFLGLYFSLQESIHFRLADFLWIRSLSAPDMLFRWGESIPLISTPDHSSGILAILYLGPYLNLLPICAAIMMFIQQKQTMPPPTDEQQAMQQNMMKYMSIFMAIMFYKVAAGLCIYFIASSLWGLAERKLLPKKKPFLHAAGLTTGTSNTAITVKAPAYSKGKGKIEKKDREEETAMDRIRAWWKEVLRQAEKK